MMENPLAKWLREHNMKPYTFAKQAGLASRTAYRFATSEKVEFENKTMRKIETATGGEVTVRAMMNWLDQLSMPAPPPPLTDEEMIDEDEDEFEDIECLDERDEQT